MRHFFHRWWVELKRGLPELEWPFITTLVAMVITTLLDYHQLGVKNGVLQNKDSISVNTITKLRRQLADEEMKVIQLTYAVGDVPGVSASKLAIYRAVNGLRPWELQRYLDGLLNGHKIRSDPLTSPDDPDGQRPRIIKKY